MGTGAAFGKTIFIGGHFLHWGGPAIVSALAFQTVATVRRLPPGSAGGWTLRDERREVPGYKEKKKSQQVESIDRVLEVMHIDTGETPLEITLGGDLLAGSGVGASAAGCVSLARALDDEFDLGLSQAEINRLGWEGEFAYHGTPSGVDNTASTYGGTMLFRIRDGEQEFEPIRHKGPLEGVLAASGVTADTSLVGGVLRAEEARDGALFQERLMTVSEQVHRLRAALEADELETVGSLMTENHRILIDMGLSHEKLIYLCDLACRHGALGARLTGGGLGGYAFALTPGKELQERVASAIESEGFPVIRATFGA